MKISHSPFARFIVVSGLGWLIDMCVFSGLITVEHLTPFAANLMSGLVGASFSFLVSHERIFNKNETKLFIKLPFYLVYTCMTILVASAAIDLLHDNIVAVTLTSSFAFSSSLAAITAKVLVTPLTLILNFIVARLMSERLAIRRDRVEI